MQDFVVEPHVTCKFLNHFEAVAAFLGTLSLTWLTVQVRRRLRTNLHASEGDGEIIAATRRKSQCDCFYNSLYLFLLEVLAEVLVILLAASNVVNRSVVVRNLKELF